MGDGLDQPAREREVTQILHAAADGDRQAADMLLPLVYEQLRRHAQVELKSERAGHTLTATAMVHEAYLKLIGTRTLPWEHRAQFYSAAATAMRQILLDHARARGSLKRGGGRGRVDVQEAILVTVGDTASSEADCVALEEAISRLEKRDPRAGNVVRLRYYAGLGVAETAMVLGVSERTVKGDWSFAKAWLEREMRGTTPEGARG